MRMIVGAILSLTALAILVPPGLGEGGQKIALRNLPKKVVAAVNAKFPGARFITAKQYLGALLGTKSW